MTWQRKKLGELLTLCDAGTWGNEDKKGLPLLRSTNMQNGNLLLTDLKTIAVPKDKVAQYTLLYGDILMTKSSGSIDHIGKSLFIDSGLSGKYGFSNFTQRLRPDLSQVLPEWIYYRVSDPATRDFLLDASQTTTGLRNLKISKLKELKIPLPPLSEQKRIVKILDEKMGKIREAKKLREEAIKDTEKILSRTLHEIFEEGKKKGWTEKMLEEVAPIKRVANKKSLPYVGMEDVESVTGEFLGSIEPKKVKSNTFYFDNSYILYGRLRPYLNKVFVPKFKGHCSTEMFPLVPNKDLSRQYLFYWMTQDSFIKKAMRTTKGARMPRANMEEVMQFKISFPSILEQKQIVKKLDTLSKKLRSLRELQTSQLEDLKELEKAYLREAFNGEL